jgi:hypothetical protein
VALAVAASLIACAAFACSTFSGDGAAVPLDGGGAESGGDEASTADVASPDAGGSVADGASDALADAATHDAHFSLACGLLPCTTVGDVCCVDRGKTPPDGLSCAGAKDICPLPTDLRLSCDDADDCALLGMPNTVCCGSLGVNGNSFFLSSTACTAVENCAAANEVLLCDRAVSGECGAGQHCDALMTFTTPQSGSGAVSPPFPACQP